MVAVAIVGVLARIATVNYNKYSARARQSEAKIKLASVYSAMHGFYAAEGTFTACIKQAGYNTDVMGAFYTVGWNNNIASNCGPNGDTACTAYGWLPDGTADGSRTCAATDKYTLGTLAIGNSTSPPGASDFANDSLTGKTFTAEAVGSIIRTTSVYDRWIINEKKYIHNVYPGIQ